MPGKRLEFIFDVVSPNAYLAWWPLKDVLARTRATLEVTPVLLGGMHKLTGNAPPMVRDAGV
jgi:2-hydroxychromene-2-carboxylate isomerase